MIYEYFLKLRNKIDLNRETTKDKIDTIYLGLIDELKLVEDDHVKNELKNKDAYVSVIDRAEIQLDEFRKRLDILKIDVKKWNDIKFESNLHTAEINRKITDFQNELLSNKIYIYESDDFDMDNLKAKITHTVVKRKENFEEFGSFHVLKKDFKQLCVTKGSQFLSEKHVFNGMDWSMALRNKGDYLGCHIQCESTINKEVSTRFKISLDNTKAIEKNKILEFEFEYTYDEEGWGSSSFISFKDIFEKVFYNQDNDSVHFAIFIQILEIYE